MTSEQLFAAMPVDLAMDILDFVAAEDRPLYKTALEAVAQTRKVRGVFLARQPKVERHKTMITSLQRPLLRLAADNLIRTWLLKKHAPLLIDFLNGLGIAHENGVVGELPPTVEEAALINVIERLLAQYPPAVVSVYLHAFNSINEAGWTNLDALLARDPRLTLQPAPAACPAHGQRCPG